MTDPELPPIILSSGGDPSLSRSQVLDVASASLREVVSGLGEDAQASISGPASPIVANVHDTRALTSVGLGFAGASGVLSGMSLVLAKAAVELVDKTKTWLRTGQGQNEFAHFQSWLIVGGLAIGGLSQLVYLNYSLAFASPALICPFAFSFFTLSSILGKLYPVR